MFSKCIQCNLLRRKTFYTHDPHICNECFEFLDITCAKPVSTKMHPTFCCATCTAIKPVTDFKEYRRLPVGTYKCDKCILKKRNEDEYLRGLSDIFDSDLECKEPFEAGGSEEEEEEEEEEDFVCSQIKYMRNKEEKKRKSETPKKKRRKRRRIVVSSEDEEDNQKELDAAAFAIWELWQDYIKNGGAQPN